MGLNHLLQCEICMWMTVTISDFSDYCQSEFLNDYIIAYTTEKLFRNLAFLSHQKVAKVGWKKYNIQFGSPSNIMLAPSRLTSLGFDLARFMYRKAIVVY